MRVHRMRRQAGLAAVATGLAIVSLTGCGSHGSSSTSKTTAASGAAATTTTATTAADQNAAVAADWTAFFSAKTPVARRVALLQDGTQFASIIKAQANSVLAKGASAKVGKVTVEGKTAAVVYDLVVDGTVALKNQKGTAVSQGGQWKVGVGSFCGLLTLENGGKTASLPAACRQALHS